MVYLSKLEAVAIDASELGALERAALGGATPTFVVRLTVRPQAKPGFFARLLGATDETTLFHVLCEDRHVILSYLAPTKVLATVIPFDGLEAHDEGVLARVSDRWIPIDLGTDPAAAELRERLRAVAARSTGGAA